MKSLAPAGLSTALLRTIQKMGFAEGALPQTALEARGDADESAVQILGDGVMLEAVFADITADDLKAAFDAAGIEWRESAGAPGLSITEILTAAGTIRTFVSGFFPADQLMSIDTLLPDAGFSGAFVQASELRFATGVGATTSQGDAAQQSDVARANFSVDGTGVTVGIISDSFGFELGSDGTTPTDTTVAQDIASGDLPAAGVQVLREGTALSSDGDEGRAMAQIVHDVAPGATLAFHTSRGGQGVFADGIRALANTAGADVIVDDIIYFAEPIFQDGIIAQAATEVYNQGVVYLSSAGNNGNDAFLDIFRGSGVDGNTIAALDAGFTATTLGELHDWNAATDVFAPYLELTVPVGSDFDLSFQWDEPFASAGGSGSTSDLDIFVTEVGSTGTETLVDFSIANNINSDAVEIVGVEADDTTAKTYRIYITQFSASSTTSAQLMAGIFFGASGQLKENYAPVILSNAAGTTTTAAPQVDAPTVFGHSNAIGALAVGASAWFNTPEFNAGLIRARLNSFSSQGGYDILFDATGARVTSARDGVDFVGPDGGNTTFFGSDSSADTDSFPNFFGTSASAPHAAGIVALLLDSVPNLTPDQIEALLEGSTSAITQLSNGTAVDSSFTGAGFVDANVALNNAQAFSSNGVPDARDDAISVGENAGTGTSGNVLGNNGLGTDNDPDGDTLTVTAVNGDPLLVGTAVALSGGGTFTLTAAGELSVALGTAYDDLQIGESETASFTYTIGDGQGDSDTATVTLTINGANDDPTAADDALGIAENAASAIIGNLLADNGAGTDADVDGDTLTISAVNGASGGVGTLLTLSNDVSVTIAANGDVTAAATSDELGAGETAFATFTYSVDDGFGGTATATATVTLTGVNDAPVAFDDRALVEAAGSIAALSVLGNDTDIDANDTLALTSLDTTGTLGLVTDNGDGTISYDPNGAFDTLTPGTSGTDSFSYTATDPAGATTTATVTITILDANTLPVAGNDVASAGENDSEIVIDVLDNDSDADSSLGDFLTLQSVVATGALGSASISANQTISYSPGAGFDGLRDGEVSTDSFSYIIVDGFGATATGVVNVTITGANDLPTPQGDAGTLSETSSAVIIDVLSNDTDPDFSDILSIVSIGDSATLGTVTLNTDGTVSYAPGNAFRALSSGDTGTDTFSYTVADSVGAESTSTVTITITGIDNIAAVNDDVSVAPVGTTLIDVLANDVSPLASEIFIAGFDTTGTLGRIVGFSDLGFSYRPPGDLTNLAASVQIADGFSYTIEDSFGDQFTADVAVTIQGDVPSTAGADTLFGAFTDDTIDGLDGNDLLVGNDGDDLLAGGAGDDLIFGDAFTGESGAAAASAAVIPADGGGVANVAMEPMMASDTVAGPFAEDFSASAAETLQAFYMPGDAVIA